MGFRLIQDDGGQQIAFAFDKDRVLIGRSEENDVQVPDAKASRRQARIERTPRGYLLIDLESRNGTSVNGTVVNQRVLAHGDVIRIGDTFYIFDDGSGPLPASSLAAPRADRAADPPTPTPAWGQPSPPTARQVVKPTTVLGKGPVLPVGGPGARPGTDTSMLRRPATRKVDPNKATVEAPRMKEVLRLQQELEEKRVIRNVVIGLGLFGAVLAILFFVNSLRAKPAEQIASEAALDAAYNRFERANAERDPQQSLDDLAEAREQLRRATFPIREVAERRQWLTERIDELWKVRMEDVSKFQKPVLDRIEEDITDPLTTEKLRELEGRLADFKKKWKYLGEGVPAKVAAIEARLAEGHGGTRKADLEEQKAKVRRLLEEENYPEALYEAEQALERARLDLTVRDAAVELREEVLSRIGGFVERMRHEAQQLRKRNRPEEARRIYDEMLKRLGNGAVFSLRCYTDLLVAERDARE